MEHEITPLNNHNTFEIETLIQDSNSLKELIRNWILLDNAELDLCPGNNDEEEHSALCISFIRNKTLICHAFFPLEVVHNEFRKVWPVSEAWLPFEKRVEDFHSCDDELLEKLTNEAKSTWNDELCTEIIDFDGGLHLAISYAISLIGVANIRIHQPSDFEEVGWEVALGVADKDIASRGRLFDLFLSYNNETDGAGWGTGKKMHVR